MATVHVYPDKLPCDTGGSFVVVLTDRLPATEEFSLTFKGTVTKKTISGKAVLIDTKTLMCTVGRYGEPEEAKVEVVGTPGARRIRSFKVSFVTRFQLICSFLPDNTQLQAPVAIARCLKDQNESRNTMDEDLAEYCQRMVPTDLSYRDFFGGELDEHMGWQATLLHFAAERGLTKFATVLLAASKGAYQALHTENHEGLTPRQIAENTNNTNMKSLFDDYESVAEGNALPLIDYVSGEDITAATNKHDHGKYMRSMLAETVAKWKALAADEKEKVKRKGIFRHLTFLRNRNKVRRSRSKEDNETSIVSKNKRSTSTDHSTNKFAGRPLPSPPASETESAASDREYEVMDVMPSLKPDVLKEKPLSSIVKTDYHLGFHDSRSALRQKIDKQGDSHWMKARGNVQNGVAPRSSTETKSGKSKSYDIGINDDDIRDIDNALETESYQTEVCEYVVTHDWKAEQPGDLSVCKGDTVAVLEKRRNQWWRVRRSTGEEGIVPETFLKESKSKRGPVLPPRQKTCFEDQKEHTEIISPPPVIRKPILMSFDKNRAKVADTLTSKELRSLDDESHNSGSSIDSGLGAMSAYDKVRRMPEPLGSKGGDYLSTNYQRPIPANIPAPIRRRNTNGNQPRQHNSSFRALQEVPDGASDQPSFSPPPLPPPHDYPKSPNAESASIKADTPFSGGELQRSAAPLDKKPHVIRRKRREKYTCIWEYEAEDETDLPLQKGDEIIVTEKHNDDWWSGTCRGKTGTFPAKFVAKLEA